MHVHLHDGEASLAAYRADVAASGLELSGLAAMWFGGPHQARAGDPAAIRAGNDGVIALARRHRDVVAVATVHPYDGQAALDELARVAAQGVRVLKLHPHTQQFDLADPRVLPLLRRAGELDLAVLLDNAGIVAGDHQRLFDLALRAPQTTFVFAHIGGLGFRFWNVLALARTAEGFSMDNVNFDISATVLLVADSPIEDEFVWTLRNVGIDRVLVGSDYPQIGLGRTVEALERLGLDEGEKAKIRSGNAQRLLDR
ncbi:amidohydrolase family protein [Pseudoxanthomonas suwonensis]|nr:amidohydrolase family protein [Pseudoxanthomonas suwonensis]